MHDADLIVWIEALVFSEYRITRIYSQSFTQSAGLLRRWINSSEGRYLRTRQHKQNKCTQISMPQVEFEPTITVFGRAKTVHAIDRAVTVFGIYGIHNDRNPWTFDYKPGSGQEVTGLHLLQPTERGPLTYNIIFHNKSFLLQGSKILVETFLNLEVQISSFLWYCRPIGITETSD
jgi:hypothetical protein